MRATTSACIVLLVAGLIGGCNSEEDTAGNGSDWSVEREAVRFEEDLCVSEAEDFFIGSANDVAVGPEDRMYVADGEAQHVKVLSPEGELLETIGREGEGPGEFRRPQNLYLSEGDSLYVTHGGLATRLSAFGPGHEFAYEISFSSSVAPHRSTPDRVIPILGESEFFGVWFPVPWPGQDTSDSEASVRRLSRDGTAGDTLFTFPGSQQLARKVGTGYKFYITPWDRGPYLALGPEGNLHYAGNDSLTVRTYDAEGTLRRVVEIPFEPVPITNADLEREFSKWSSAEDVGYVRDIIPSTKPVFKHFLVDDEGRYWFKRPTDDHERVDWWIVDADERRVLTGRMPAHVDFSMVRDGYAYGTIEGDDVLPAVVRYRLIEE